MGSRCEHECLMQKGNQMIWDDDLFVFRTNVLNRNKQQFDIAILYSILIRKYVGQSRIWPQVNSIVKQRWPKGLKRVKTLAWKIYEGELK